MPITDKATVKLIGALYSITGDGAPTTSTVGVVGDIYLDVDDESVTYGNTYLCTAITGTTTLSYTWVTDSREDARFTLIITRVERDYLRIRGIAFDVVDEATVYPDGADVVAAEMVLYVASVTDGRGKTAESLGDRSGTYESKIAGYPVSIVGQIERYVSVP